METDDRPTLDRVEITEAMIEAGADVLLCDLGGAVSSHWHPDALAASVYRAMDAKRLSRRPHALHKSRKQRAVVGVLMEKREAE